MKLDKWLGIEMNTQLTQQCKDKFTQTMESGTISDIGETFFTQTQRNYLICETTKKVIGNLKLSDKFFDYTDFKDNAATLLVDKDTYYRFFIKGGYVNCMRFAKVKSLMGSRYTWDCFFIDPLNRTVTYSNRKLKESDLGKLPDFIQEFLKVFIFIYCTDTEIEVVEGGRSNGKPKKDGKVVNMSRFPVTVVTTKWNTITVRAKGFKVKGHFRFQPYGSRSEKKVKVIFIDPYEKKGYTRKGKN